jgi:choline-glycine betaine transporter
LHVLVVVFCIAFSASAALVIEMIAAGGKTNAPLIQRSICRRR